MPRGIVPFVAAVALLAGGFLLGRSTRSESTNVRAGRTSVDPETVAIRRQLDEERATTAALRARVAELETRPVATPEPAPEPAPEVAPAPAREAPATPPTDDEVQAAVKAFGPSLQALILGQEQGQEAAEKLRGVLKRATREQIERLVAKFRDDTTGFGERYLYAHVLAQSGQPAAIEELEAVLRDPESDLVLQRTAAHGLAFSDAHGVKDFSLEIARTTQERGVRANLAFGLVRRGVDEGVGLYFSATDEAFEAKDPAALQYLSGFYLMKHPDVTKGVRERLLTYEDEQAKLLLIGIVREKGDKQSIATLERLAYDANQPPSIQKAAQAAIDALSKP